MAQDLLTVGMATYQDPDGVWFTLQALNEFHPRVPVVVLDNAPKSCARTASVTRAVGGTYLHRPDLSGTSASRNHLFAVCRTPWLLVCDSHVVFGKFSIDRLLELIESNPDSADLIQGPLLHDDGVGLSTHWRQDKPPLLSGVWDRDKRGDDPNNPPFEIPMQGLGAFAMRCEAWPGFNPHFRGFGGEEGYIHEKVRQRGGKVLCLPGLRWRHRFRDGVPPPYPLKGEDHAFNLLVGHRELGIDAFNGVCAQFKSIPRERAKQLDDEAAKCQWWGEVREGKPRLRMLGVWYSNNSAPDQLLAASLGTIKAARDSSRHRVQVTLSHQRPLPFEAAFPAALSISSKAGHARIVEQIRQCIGIASAIGHKWDAICFLEHDVLYPPDYFDRVGDAFGRHLGAEVVSNLNYVGLNGSGWQAVRERHEPMHQLAMTRDAALRNLDRAQADCDRQGWAYLEPQGDRRTWVRLPPTGPMPSVHVNHPGQRFTSHGDVCYEPNGRPGEHDFWGSNLQWWPGEVKAVSKGGCGCKGEQATAAPAKARRQPAAALGQTLHEWFDKARTLYPDVAEHMVELSQQAAGLRAAEITATLNGALVALAFGQPNLLVSACVARKPEWQGLRNLGVPLVGIVGEPLQVQLPEVDFLFIDTAHRAELAYRLLVTHGRQVRERIALHDTTTWGERGDDGGPGCLAGLRRFLREQPEWTVVKHVPSGGGLTIISKVAADKKPLPNLVKQAWNYGKAMAAHAAAGGAMAEPERVELRLAACDLCDQRNGNRCGVCGCYLDSQPNGKPGKAALASSECPLGKWPANG